MVKARKAVAYRKLERPYTRVSKFREKSYIRTTHTKRVIKFAMGNQNKNYDTQIDLVASDSLQIRDIAIESARQTSLRFLEKHIGLNDFFFIVRPYPHHILRENPLASGAGADRFSTGMSHSFGKPIGQAAQIKKGQILVSVYVNKQHLETAKKAVTRAKHKVPCSCSVRISENK